MSVHRIDLAPSRHDRAVMMYDGQPIGESRQPLFSAARFLLARGLSQPDDLVATYRGAVMCLRAPVRMAAKLRVMETASGPKFWLYEDTSEIRSRFKGHLPAARSLTSALFLERRYWVAIHT